MKFKSIFHVCKRYSAIHIFPPEEKSLALYQRWVYYVISIFHCKISGLTIFITCSAVEGTGEFASSDAEIKGSATLGSIFNTDS